MVLTDETPNGTLLTLVNWEDFNGVRDTKRDTDKDTDKDTYKDTDKDTGKDKTIMIKNENNDKEVKKRTPRPPRGGGQWQ